MTKYIRCREIPSCVSHSTPRRGKFSAKGGCVQLSWPTFYQAILQELCRIFSAVVLGGSPVPSYCSSFATMSSAFSGRRARIWVKVVLIGDARKCITNLWNLLQGLLKPDGLSYYTETFPVKLFWLNSFSELHSWTLEFSQKFTADRKWKTITKIISKLFTKMTFSLAMPDFYCILQANQ